VTQAVTSAVSRSTLRAVSVPTEHGGWGLTLEPALLGLLVAPSAAGAFVGAAAVVAFLARTPLRLVLVDRWRGRSLDRTRIARRVFAVDALVIVLLAGAAVLTTSQPFWWPLVAAGPLVGVELWFDMRSRSRRLLPELAGAIGISAVAAAIVLAGGATGPLAGALWLILAARAVTSIPHVRVQVARLHRRGASSTARWDVAALTLAGCAVVLDTAVAAGAIAVAAVVVVQRVLDRGALPPAKIIGLRQLGLGLAVVAITAAGVHVA
jgi:hypothetical protein